MKQWIMNKLKFILGFITSLVLWNIYDFGSFTYASFILISRYRAMIEYLAQISFLLFSIASYTIFAWKLKDVWHLSFWVFLISVHCRTLPFGFTVRIKFKSRSLKISFCIKLLITSINWRLDKAVFFANLRNII